MAFVTHSQLSSTALAQAELGWSLGYQLFASRLCFLVPGRVQQRPERGVDDL